MNELDWSGFDPRGPRSPRSLRYALSDTEAVFRAAVRGARALANGRELPGVLYRIFVDNAEVRAGEKTLLPTADDLDWPSYARRVTSAIGGRKFGLLINNIQTLSPELFDPAHIFLSGYQRVHGVAGTVRLTAFMGTYAQTAFGPHTDPGHLDVFQFVIEGQKRMRCWDPILVERTPGMATSLESAADYSRWLPLATSVEGGPGSLLYWPGTSWHVGEALDDHPHVALSMVISRPLLSPRRFLQGALDDVLDTFAEEGSPNYPWSSIAAPELDPQLTTVEPLLEHLARSADALKIRAVKRALSALSKRGWEYPPPPRDEAALDDDDFIKKSSTAFSWQLFDHSILIAALGNIFEVTRDADVEGLLTLAGDGRPHRLGALLDLHAPARDPETRGALRGLLEELYRDRAFDKHTGAADEP